ncbi:MAG: imidazole glycerol phosphate synthase subunit HisF [Candidatus Methylarchaceae archaeon HK01B]|nr:imidazole glycerol phosphate synthase subunit HisF [Candidatus Methylarchaceae archaeon HK01M]MCP8311828.1 imidazole glycerol phosphate synthase subunit HisF [Candidatus Methylarchaceae archaeon HK02M1]MCP8318611.1 imidazole glycerol phosphate synthase subunit HisF [Candidatus Methylarchaceae archaeon HK01B]
MKEVVIVKIMPCLDVKEGRIVKGIHFVDLRDAGDPVENARFYEKEGADELAMLDIAATVERRNTKLEWVKKVKNAISIPLVVGGGISNLGDMEELFDLGVSKISINTAAVKRPKLIRNASEKFGKERIIVAIDGRRNVGMPSGFEVVIKGGTEGAGIDAFEWAKRCEELGAGELLPTSIDGDGTLSGYDIDFTRVISDAVEMPIIASGGAGTLEHLYEAVVKGKATTLLAASIFHFRKYSIREVKEFLKSRGIDVRL